ncbi:MAG: serine hydrolase [Actinobacteria bacterium]|nr:serine hydrolase [Actinomycetota bacterium]
MRPDAPHTQSGRRGWLVTAVCLAAGAVCLALWSTAGPASVTHAGAGPAEATAQPSTSPSPETGGAALTTTVLGSVTVHSGSVARVRYRADGPDGDTVTVDLVITTRAGDVRRRLVTGRVVRAGEEQAWRGRLRLRRGRYLLVAHAVDANGVTESSARAAKLVVLRPVPPLVPSAGARRAAFTWASKRSGAVAVAVVDSHGHLHGRNAHRRFLTASLAKPLLLVAYLRRNDTVTSAMRKTLTRMITVSDNDAADAVYRSVGVKGLRRLAKLAGMRSFETNSAWILCRASAADMACFFRDMERYVPRRHRRFVNRLLTSVVPYQSWGIPEAARPRGYRVYFKPGWLGAWTLASEAARLERKRVRIGLAVFTDDNPTSSYGKETVAGVTARLLRR